LSIPNDFLCGSIHRERAPANFTLKLVRPGFGPAA
jgi:hypothetical protein